MVHKYNLCEFWLCTHLNNLYVTSSNEIPVLTRVFFLTCFGFGRCESVKCLGEGLSKGLMGNEIRALPSPMQCQGETADLHFIDLHQFVVSAFEN